MPRTLLALVVGCGLFTSTLQPAEAETAFSTATVASQTHYAVVEALKARGYTVVNVKRTLLGRIKITVENENPIREIVVSRSTGELKNARVIENMGQGS